MTALHIERHFEDEICQHLASNGWLHSPDDASQYDKTNALFLPDLVAWLQDTQPDAWEAIQKNHGAQAEKMLAERVRTCLNEKGTLEVLRRGFDVLGLRKPINVVQFRPALNINPELETAYQSNRLRVIRQVRHSLNNPQEAIDLLLLVNGIPVATAELKSDFTQSVGDAVDQYRFDRNPQPKGKMLEPLLAFPSGALVHFAVSQSEVMMATRLNGADTQFLPFNKGNNGGAGNAPNPNGFATAYLWQEIWQKDSWLEILGRYLIGKRDDKHNLLGYIFPRYHQLNATRKLLADVLSAGVGGRYLIQHSAGSGKTNSIAWSAHFLADLHTHTNQKMFDCVLVVSDRTVLDKQLQEAIFDFERTKGVVAVISDESPESKSVQLSKALESNKKIIVCTIQTFPFALAAVQELSATQNKRFAVIADEAHSSQTGEAASKLKQVLSAEELESLKDGGEFSTEDVLASQMEARASKGTLTYVAFTATPKSKTLELFGRKDANGIPQAFHVYSMRQAIEEGFILDVLKNYTPYSLAFKLTHNGQEYSDKEIDRSEAVKGIMNWVRLHPYNIAQKVQVVVEHYLQNVQPLLAGRAKAMVVVSSRKEAVRWQKAILQYIKSNNYNLGCLVAFSGEVSDEESFPEAVSERSRELNANLNGRDIREAFNTAEYHLLLVANKFQTGFDQPLLCGMYVDKLLGGIQAVQTLSRLNRAYQKEGVIKDTTYILDFVNRAEDILSAFKAYYETAELEANTDPNLIFTLKSKLDTTGFYDDFEVNRVAEAHTNPKFKQSDLSAAIAPVADRLLNQYKSHQHTKQIAEANQDGKALEAEKNAIDVLLLFKADIISYVRLYSFLSQIVNYGNPDIEKRHIFYKLLAPLLEFGRERDSFDDSKLILTHSTLRQRKPVSLDLGAGETPKLEPITGTGTGVLQEKQKALLDEIIKKVNGLFEGELTDGDQLVYVNGVLKGKLLENQTLIEQAASNSKEQFANSPDLRQALSDAIMDTLEAHTQMGTQAINSDKIRNGLRDALLGPCQLWEGLRSQSVVREDRPL